MGCRLVSNARSFRVLCECTHIPTKIESAGKNNTLHQNAYYLLKEALKQYENSSNLLQLMPPKGGKKWIEANKTWDWENPELQAESNRIQEQLRREIDEENDDIDNYLSDSSSDAAPVEELLGSILDNRVDPC